MKNISKINKENACALNNNYYLCRIKNEGSKLETELSFSKDSLAMGQVGVGDMRFIGEFDRDNQGFCFFCGK